MNARCTAGCGRPSPDAYLCSECTQALLRDLQSVPTLTRELTTTLARLDRVPAASGAGPESGSPLPFRLAVTQAASTLRWTLRPWVATIAEQQHRPPLRWKTTISEHARWLARRIDAIRHCAPAIQPPGTEGHHQGAAQLFDEIRYAIHQTRRAINRPPALFYAGPCQGEGCGADLYCGADDRGWPTAGTITCRACGQRHDTTERRQWLLREVEERLATAGEISQAIPALYGRDIRIGTIRVWAHRGRITPRLPHPNDPLQRPRYRVGDVLDIASLDVNHERKERQP